MINVQTRRTYADYLETSDDEPYEILNGELAMAPAPRTAHQIIAILSMALIDQKVQCLILT